MDASSGTTGAGEDRKGLHKPWAHPALPFFWLKLVESVAGRISFFPSKL